MHTIPEHDWKVLRELKSVALNRYCEIVIEEARRLMDARGVSAHERYLSVFAAIEKRDQAIAEAFNDIRRSTAFLHIIAIRALGVLRPDELARFSDETQTQIQSRDDALDGL
jgi:hypothetical protein